MKLIYIPWWTFQSIKATQQSFIVVRSKLKSIEITFINVTFTKNVTLFLFVQNRRFLIAWSRSVKRRRQVCSGCLWRTWHRWEENCWTFTNGIQQNCILFYREWWWNFLQSDWKKEALEGPRGGMAIPCKLFWTSSNKRHVKKLDALIAAEKIKILRRYGLRV